MATIRHFAGKVPILGVCLGHQSIGQAFGGRVVHARQVMHGKTSLIRHRGVGRVSRLARSRRGDPLSFPGDRQGTLPDCLEVTAWTETADGQVDEIMGVRHRELAVEGVQFHPESILTQHGHDMLKNFLEMKVATRA